MRRYNWRSLPPWYAADPGSGLTKAAVKHHADKKTTQTSAAQHQGRGQDANRVAPEGDGEDIDGNSRGRAHDRRVL